MERAEWLLRKLGNIAAEKARIQAQAAAMVNQLESDTANLQHLYGKQLEAFTREELARRGNRRKSLTTLQGTCAFRTVPGGFCLIDPAAALEHVQSNFDSMDALVELQPCLKTEEYRLLAERHFAQTGELLPGTEERSERENFSIKFGKSE